MKYVLHKANTRGHADHGWLNAHHSFSFAGWYNPERINFGALRVLNDDIVAPGMGFGTHPHDNMEIITIPLHGSLRHQDSMGNGSVIRSGEVQVMSAGTGILHSEFNPDDKEELNLFQIWIFPHTKNVEPRYDQIVYDKNAAKNQFLELVGPDKNGPGTWINQNAWIKMANLDDGTILNYEINDNENGVYLMIIEGEAEINGQFLNKRDAIGIWATDKIEIKAIKGLSVLAIEVPMSF